MHPHAKGFCTFVFYINEIISKHAKQAAAACFVRMRHNCVILNVNATELWSFLKQHNSENNEPVCILKDAL